MPLKVIQGHRFFVPIESPYATYFLLVSTVILTYIISRTVSKLLQIIGQLFAFDRAIPLFNVLAIGGKPLNLCLQISASLSYWGEKYLDMLNRLGVANVTDRRIDRQTAWHLDAL